ncbi:YwpF-like family protein [Alkalihalobacillus sp. MEB130]|uniref:YwpF family protein n=1 Tax=Alkalihalobacillus sp. MEB130 TaxID=2976704 RepID=UPI0028E04FDC|nr:YwpF family protein [Alkalihalobacillus sp. MEB130]MDT8862993.1 YwpF-like family protein [Alkalihalobacillus sp. MEB130]
MKTFKLYSLSLLEGKEGKVNQKLIPIQDGLIVNMENPSQTWYIEAVISEDYYDYFREIEEEERHILVDVIITSKDNHPAAMITKVQTITKLTESISILLEAKLALKRDVIIEDVLKDLVSEGYSEEQLLTEFHNKMENLAAHPQSALDTIYRSIKESGQYNLQ